MGCQKGETKVWGSGTLLPLLKGGFVVDFHDIFRISMLVQIDDIMIKARRMRYCDGLGLFGLDVVSGVPGEFHD